VGVCDLGRTRNKDTRGDVAICQHLSEEQEETRIGSGTYEMFSIWRVYFAVYGGVRLEITVLYYCSTT